MRFGKFSLAAIAVASLICAPVMARSLDSPAYTDTKNITAAPVVETPAAQSAVIGGAPSAATIEGYIPLTQDYVFREEDVRFAVMRTGPVGITSLQATSLVDLSTKSRFDNFADRLRALNAT